MTSSAVRSERPHFRPRKSSPASAFESRWSGSTGGNAAGAAPATGGEAAPASGMAGVARASERAVWRALCPDPNLIVRVPASRLAAAAPPKAETLEARRARIGGNLSVTVAGTGGAVTQTGALVVTGTTTINAGAHFITLTTGTNSFTGTLALTTTGANESTLTQLAQNLAAKTGLAPPAQSPSQIAGQQAVARLLAASLLDGPAGTGALSAKATADIMSGLQQNGFVSFGATPAPANLAVLVAPGGAPPQSGSEVLVAVATALKHGGDATVMAGASESVGSDSVISNEKNSADPVSTVDNADTESGQIMVVQALKYLLEGKAPAEYGINSGNVPSPAPTPSATPSSTVTAGGHP